MKKLYFGCSLSSAPEEYATKVLELRQQVAALPEVEHLPFLTDIHPDSNPHDIFKWDIFNQVAQADIMVAECTQPSFGLGWEVSHAVHVRKIPVLAFAHVDFKEKLSKFAPGADVEELPNYSFSWYKDNQEILDVIQKNIS